MGKFEVTLNDAFEVGRAQGKIEAYKFIIRMMEVTDDVRGLQEIVRRLEQEAKKGREGKLGRFFQEIQTEKEI